MSTSPKKATLAIKRSDLPKLNKALSKLIEDSKKQTADVITLANLVELKYETLEKLKPVDVVAMLKTVFNLNVTAATFRNYLKAEKMRRAAVSPAPSQINVEQPIEDEKIL